MLLFNTLMLFVAWYAVQRKFFYVYVSVSDYFSHIFTAAVADDLLKFGENSLLLWRQPSYVQTDFLYRVCCHVSIHFWATVCKTVRPMLSVHCLSVCLSVTLVHCGQTVGRIRMKLGLQVGLGPDHIVLDGDPAPPPPKGEG